MIRLAIISQLFYLPHFFIQGDNVSEEIEDMDLEKEIRLHIFNNDATEILFDDFLTSEEVIKIKNKEF